MPLIPGFGGPDIPAPSAPPPPPPPPEPPPPPPTIEDPGVTAAKQALRISQLQRRGPGSTILTGGQGVLGDPTLDRPQGTTLG